MAMTAMRYYTAELGLLEQAPLQAVERHAECVRERELCNDGHEVIGCSAR
jgi:hypothetical protein